MSSQGGRGKNKRSWTRPEEEVLIAGLLELSTDPSWKADGSFKSGFKAKLEEQLEQKFPGCGLEAVPHIESKIKWFKDKFNVLTEMFRTSGFSWDDQKHMIMCERQSYDDFCRQHKNAQGLWNTPFPFYEQLTAIFGVDRATGAASETFPQAVENQGVDVVDLDRVGDDDIDDIESEFNSAHSVQSGTSTRNAMKGKGKKRKLPEGTDIASSLKHMSSDMSKFMDVMGTQMTSIASALTTTQEHEHVTMVREQAMEDKKNNLINELLKIPGITRYEALVASRKLVNNESELTLFYASPDDEWRKDYVLNLVHPRFASGDV